MGRRRRRRARAEPLIDTEEPGAALVAAHAFYEAVRARREQAQLKILRLLDELREFSEIERRAADLAVEAARLYARSREERSETNVEGSTDPGSD